MNDTKSDAAKGSDLDALIDELQRIAGETASKHPRISDAALGLIAACDYEDETLLDSSWASLLAALAEVANRCVARELAASEGTQTGIREAWQKRIDKQAYELSVFEKIKDKIESVIDERIASMLKVRMFVRSLEEDGQQVGKSQALEDGIRQLRKFREELLRVWPARRPASPIDREAVSKAREAIRRGEKGMSKDQLIWGGKRSEKAVEE
jgi:hypothetical protein